MNKLQQIEFEMLEAFVDVCEKLNLKYYLVCGSALGAVKYGGFIPWDDDIDVALPRADYEVFCREAQKYLPKHVFLQNYRTDKECPCIISRLRNCNTTYIIKLYKKWNCNHGAFIDVMPLDVYPHENIAKFEKQKMKFARRRAAYLYEEKSCFWKHPRSFLVKVWIRLLGEKNLNRHIKEFDEFVSNPSFDSNILCNYGNWQGKLEYAPIEQYGEGISMNFEGLEVRVPSKYDEYLTQKYGDWRADLPEEQKVGHHYYEIMDLDHPYTDYIEKVYKNGRKIKLRKTPKK